MIIEKVSTRVIYVRSLSWVVFTSDSMRDILPQANKNFASGQIITPTHILDNWSEMLFRHESIKAPLHTDIHVGTKS